MSSTSEPRPSTPGGRTRSQAGEADESSASTVHGVVPTRTVDVVVLVVGSRPARQRPCSWR
ncbi:hypothetical protein D187_009336 [Cystobacter fuscus DSM 2262]|uniref:Uncharacterized protein n=1 Tax=Cystobacter fuscus (strain ATCC 25194 / DSM 2262 / NBRC 100088 / M29) TaxID=1242864 RepID=S9NWP8_CYSF2|nr:hypothetical protein D187_009336 [Cystobacter fuscus DSM 2262]